MLYEWEGGAGLQMYCRSEHCFFTNFFLLNYFVGDTFINVSDNSGRSARVSVAVAAVVSPWSLVVFMR
jgi:hypothetical protein